MKVFRFPGVPPETVTREEFATLARDVFDLKHQVRTLLDKVSELAVKPAYADQVRWSAVGDGSKYNDVSSPGLAGFTPWVSTKARFAESLTSPQFVLTTLGEAALIGVTFAGLAGFVALIAHLPWYTSPAVGLAGAALSCGVLVGLNRSHLADLVKSQSPGKRTSELTVKVDSSQGGYARWQFLYLRSDITEAQLREFARVATEGGSLAVHIWTGAGGLFTRSQYDGLMSELELAGFVRSSQGNVARCLTIAGKSLMRKIAEGG